MKMCSASTWGRPNDSRSQRSLYRLWLEQILFGVSLTVETGECVALLGRNGVGKTTTLRSIMGLTAPHRGTVRYNGVDITGRPGYQVAKLGLGFVPEDRRIFPDLTVRQNLEAARKAPALPHGREWTIEAVFQTFPALAGLAVARRLPERRRAADADDWADADG